MVDCRYEPLPVETSQRRNPTAAPYTHRNLREVEDSAARFGFGETQETRFANDDLETEQTGFSHHRIKPGRRQPFGHRHERAEEVYVVISGSGRVKLDDEILDVQELDAVRVSPGVIRAFEAGERGLEILAFGPRLPADRGEIIQGWWAD
ncbi:MAG: cupin domain-containing protein [Actinomycetota bacterium]|nr:cupin domain-containing protein [Actinomycetota bacterium]